MLIHGAILARACAEPQIVGRRHVNRDRLGDATIVRFNRDGTSLHVPW